MGKHADGSENDLFDEDVLETDEAVLGDHVKLLSEDDLEKEKD